MLLKDSFVVDISVHKGEHGVPLCVIKSCFVLISRREISIKIVVRIAPPRRELASSRVARSIERATPRVAGVF